MSFKGVWMRYRPELPPVLKGVTFDIAASEKIGARCALRCMLGAHDAEAVSLKW